MQCGMLPPLRFLSLLFLPLPVMMALLSGAAAARVSAQEEEKQRPNFIFVLADDFRWDVLGHRGNGIVKTPHLDALAAEGVVFRNAFTTTSICSVSRASFLTGQWMRRHGIDDFKKGLSEAQWRESYPVLLRQAGYHTGFVGKYGVGDARATAAAAAKFDVWAGQKGQGVKDFIDPADPERKHETAKLGDRALDFLRGAPEGRPYCLSLSFSAVHARDKQPREFQPDTRDEGLYADLTIPSPPTANEAAFLRLPPFIRTSEGRTRWGWRFDTPEKNQGILRDYYRLVTGLDREIGRLREAVATRGDAGRTVIVFFGDNGFALGDRGLADKWFMYEESLRIPALVCDPRQPAATKGREVSEMVLNVDLAPTLLELAGIAAPERMQGRSLAPWLREGTPDGWRKDFFYEHHTLPKIIPPSEGVRTEEWKYIRWIDREPVVEELYDLRNDPLEEKNLIGEEKAAGELEKLRERWRELGDGLR